MDATTPTDELSAIDAVSSEIDSLNDSADIGCHSTDVRSSVKQSSQLISLYAPISTHLERIEDTFDKELQTPYESVTPVLRHGTQLGGKRLRPALLLLAGQSVGEVCDDHITLGTVIEMVHTATLVHDDVLDDAESRRHMPTINAKWDNHTSILVGDYLFAQSYRLAATLPSTEACQLIGEASRRICEGEMRQVLMRNILETDESTYIEMIRGKTAELCQVACRLGAKLAEGSSAQVESLARFGDSLGIAFQIADDYLDLWGDDSQVGKTLGTDIEQGKMTLPVIRLLETASEKEREKIVGILKGPVNGRVSAIRRWIERSDSREYTQQVAKTYYERALESLSELPPSAAKESLETIAFFAIKRGF